MPLQDCLFIWFGFDLNEIQHDGGRVIAPCMLMYKEKKKNNNNSEFKKESITKADNGYIKFMQILKLNSKLDVYY